MRSIARVIFIYTGLLSLMLGVPTRAEEIHHHEGESAAVDEFYSTWMMPDSPTRSCCNKLDCYSPERVERRADGVYFMRREDRRMVRVPPEKIEQDRDNPDGRNHVCASPPSFLDGGAGVVYCFIFGGGT